MGRRRAIGEGASHAAPGLDWPWRLEPIGAKGGRCIRNTFKDIHAISNATAYLTMLGCDNGIHGSGHWHTSLLVSPYVARLPRGGSSGLFLPLPSSFFLPSGKDPT